MSSRARVKVLFLFPFRVIMNGFSLTFKLFSSSRRSLACFARCSKLRSRSFCETKVLIVSLQVPVFLLSRTANSPIVVYHTCVGFSTTARPPALNQSSVIKSLISLIKPEEITQFKVLQKLFAQSIK